jgi:hypothetical protein
MLDAFDAMLYALALAYVMRSGHVEGDFGPLYTLRTDDAGSSRAGAPAPHVYHGSSRHLPS